MMRPTCGEWLLVGVSAVAALSCGHAPATCRDLLLPCIEDDAGARDGGRSGLNDSRDAASDRDSGGGKDATGGARGNDSGENGPADAVSPFSHPTDREAASDRVSEADASVDGSSAGCNAEGSPATSPCLVDDAYGVFVAPGGADVGNGSKAHPFGNIAAGLTAAKAGHKRVFVCAQGGAAVDFNVPVVMDANLEGSRIHGGFRCSDWQYVANAPTIVRTDPGQIPLTFASVSGVAIEDFSFEAAPAAANGGSSIAAFATGAKGVTLRRVVLKAGAGKNGAAVGPASNHNGDPAPGGLSATSITGGGKQACSACADGRLSAGGKGGSITADANGQLTLSQAGEDGQPKLDGKTEGDNGQGGKAGASCTDGTGHDGASGSAAAGGKGAEIHGKLEATGWIPTNGQSGQNGSPGQGGGGGAGRYTEGVGIGGGGGACGGCGGAGGPGGKGGGASFALLSYQSNSVLLDTCVLIAQEAGQGSPGAAGQQGQSGGSGGARISSGCAGGNGGKGGDGGGGGGGAGGVSAAIAYVGEKPVMTGAGSVQIAAKAATGGAPGARGAASQPAAKGIEGVAVEYWQVP